MKRSVESPAPGTLFLRLSRLLFDESIMTGIINPAVGDFQEELRLAHFDTATRRWRLRGLHYIAFCILLTVLPLRGTRSQGGVMTDSRSRGGTSVLRVGSLAFLVITLLGLLVWNSQSESLIFVSAEAFLGLFMVIAILIGLVFSGVMHWWNSRPVHSSTGADVPESDVSRRPQINLSGIKIGGDVGGLMFVVGIVLIAILGLPQLRQTMLVAVVAGLLLARALFVWHRSHSASRLSEYSITPRSDSTHR